MVVEATLVALTKDKAVADVMVIVELGIKMVDPDTTNRFSSPTTETGCFYDSSPGNELPYVVGSSIMVALNLPSKS
jgi:hypothetical protein